MQVHVRHGVDAARTEAGPQQRHARAIRSDDRFCAFAGHFNRNDRRPWRQRDFQKRLRAMTHLQHHLCQRPALGRNQRRRHRPIGDGRQYSCVGKSLHVHRQSDLRHRVSLVKDGISGRAASFDQRRSGSANT
ncbi:MAG: hypothetical protein DMF98_12955 [Acidobacteria bacterium]|nr:MAG: hypothetical protein DMF98_12955 [Acidobacteriota bacterium]